MIDVKVGDTVIITEHRREPHEATVTKVGRVWFTVGEGYQEVKFRLDDGTTGSGYTSAPHAFTPEQWDERLRISEASTFLREQGISIEYPSLWRGREIELANLIRSAG
jgi:hypothetical protein